MHRKIACALITCCSALHLITSPANSAEVIAQYIAPNNGNIAGFAAATPNYIPAQTFTTTGGGEVKDVTVSLAANGGNGAYVLLEIRTVSGGLPTATVLGSANVVSPALTGAPQDFTADFTGSGVTLLPSTMYAITLQTDGGAWACGEFNGTYPGGMTVQSFDSGASFSPTFFSHDLQFTVTAVPEPATIAMVGLAILGPPVVMRRRIRKR